MAEALIFYKLVSPYPEDQTRDCKLSVSDIDHNFLTLKDYDIKEIKLSEDEKSIVLVRNNGEELSTSLPDFIRDLEFDWDKENGTLIVKWGDNETVIDGILTDEDGLLKAVSHGSTLSGDGTIDNPLEIALTDRTGMYAPVKEIIDMTEGGELPENPTIGDRYLTCEWLSDYGYLYNYNAVSEIIQNLSDQTSEWRVPSKSDWDTLLNSIEPCDYQNHNEEDCHVMLGKYAGIKLKSKDGWKECIINPTIDEEGLENSPLQPGGIDEYGFRVLPAGDGNEEGYTGFFTEKTGFWSTSHIKTPGHEEESGDPRQDIYVKIFDYRKTGVIQDAECPEKYYSLRLVKDYNGHNYKDIEVINGISYKTLLFNDTKQVWTSINVAYPTEDGKIIPNGGEGIDKKKVFFISVFNGKIWEKKQLLNGDSVVANSGKTYENEEYRVFLDADGNEILLAVDDVVYERVMAIVGHLIEEEARIREEVDNQQWDAINNEARIREEVDNQQWEAINNEARIREEVDNQQWDAIVQESITREEVDNQQWEAINNEARTREEVDNQQWEAINNEARTREEIDNQQWAAIENEARTREEVDNQQWAAIENEARTREEIDNQQWAAIENEARIREDVDNQQWGQIIDNPNDPTGKKNPNTPNEYVIKVNNNGGTNITLFSKGGTNDIEIFFDSNYGEL